ncbi:transmembrane amino acid transporter protein [Fragilaria crotonensis]|nr:transmembrane amino acid transporter protein [Fragilaria crotonensis]
MPTAATNDVEVPVESTPLIELPSSLSSDTADVEATIVASEENEVLLNEMNAPWPATFERGISLLASPVVTARQVNLVTKSPKPGSSFLFGRGATNVRDQRRGYYTPEQIRGRPLRPTTSMDDSDLVDKKKMKAVDFRDSLKQGLVATTRTKQQEAAEAHAYRQQLLEAQNKIQNQDAMMSPGYGREKSLRQRVMNKPKKASGDKATFAQCVFNMCNILMGVGMLGLPFVFKSAGWLGGLLVTVMLGLITWRTAILIGRQLNGDHRHSNFFDDSPFKSPVIPGSTPGARTRAPMTSFPQIAREAFGDRGSILLSSVLYFELFSCLCIFLVTVGDHLVILFPSVSKTMHMVLSSVALTIPTAFLKTPRLLSYLSMVGTFATASVIMAVLASAIVEGDISERAAEHRGMEITGPTHIRWCASGLPTALGLIAYTFSGHAIVPSIYSSMERPQDFERMIDTSFLIVIGSCCVVAFSGYYMFGSAVEDQVTLSLEQNSSAALAMKCLTWLMILTASSKYTLTMFPLALGVEEIVAPFIPNETIMAAADSIIKLSLIVLSLLVAIFVPSFSYICALVGLICTMSVSIIFPAGAHLVLFDRQLSAAEKIVNWLFVLVGIVVAIVGTIATV